MKAIVREAYGPPDVLHLADVPTPAVRDGNVLCHEMFGAGGLVPGLVVVSAHAQIEVWVTDLGTLGLGGSTAALAG
jgi:hypothetical protein